MPDTRFHVAEVKDATAGTEFSGHIRHLPTIPSTNDLALASARAGARTGVWIADEQTAGRGRGSHGWHSVRGDGLYMSALVTPAVPIQSALRLSFRIAMAVQAAIASIAGFRIRDQIDIRWPNDLMLARPNAPARKCGGILIDTAARSASTAQPAMLRHAVIGFGINVNHLHFPQALDSIATSLRRELPGQPRLRREPLAAAILRELDATIRALAANPQPATSHFEPYSSWLNGKRVRVERRETETAESYTGTTAGLDPQGFLRVLDDSGQLRTVLSGGLRELQP